MNERDRRAHERLQCLVDVEVASRSCTWLGQILDYSESGVFVSTRAPVDVGDTLTLKFRRPGDSEMVLLRGMVKRLVASGVKKRKQEGFGLQFFELLSTVPEGEPIPTEPVPGTQTQDFASREARYHVEMDVTFVRPTSRKKPRKAAVINVSRGGLCLATDVPPKASTLLQVRFEGQDVDGKKEAVTAKVQSVWVRRQEVEEAVHAGVGCKIVGFISLDGRDRFDRMIERLQRKTGPGDEEKDGQ